MKCALAIVVGLTILGLASCEKKATPEPPPPPVSVATAKAENVPLSIDTFGNCVTIANVTLQTQVEGILQPYAIAQGAMVQSGDLIATIDPAPYQAAVEEAQGNLDSAQANLANAQVSLQRNQQLYKTKTIDLADLQTAEANQLQAQGAVLTAEGQLANAKINLGYCRITAPVAGKAGLYLTDAGNLVTANNTQIINVQTIDPIYVDFTISENDFDKVRQYFIAGNLDVQVTIPGVPGEIITGKLTVINNAIASDTGTLMLRATFANPEALLWPGLFVNVKLILTTLENAVVVPSQCVMVGQQGPYVFVLNADNTVAQKLVTVGQQQSDFAVISSGVSAGDKIVTAGQLGLTTGKKVTPVAYQPPASQTVTTSSAAPAPATK